MEDKPFLCNGYRYATYEEAVHAATLNLQMSTSRAALFSEVFQLVAVVKSPEMERVISIEDRRRINS